MQVLNEQNVNKIAVTKNVLEHLPEGQLFEDPYFKAESFKSSFISSLKDGHKIEWKRPQEISRTPSLGIDSTHYKDVIQGQLDDCALISALTSLTLHPSLFHRIFDLESPLYGEKYKGFVKINIWTHQNWTPIYIDDLLPTINGELVFARSRNQDHFWISLLEKAFAKLNCGYEKLIGIDSGLVIQSLTSGLILQFNPTRIDHRHQIIDHLKRSQSVLFCVIGAELSSNCAKDCSESVRTGHSFSVLDMVDETYIKIRNSLRSIQIDKSLFVPNDPSNGLFLLRIEDLFSYFEIFTILMISNDGSIIEPRISLYTEINDSNCIQKSEINLMKQFINCPHHLIGLDGSCDIIINLEVENHLRDDFTGTFILPIRSNDKRSGQFIDFNFFKPTLSNSNLHSKLLKLHQGNHLIGVLINSTNLPRTFHLRIGCLDENKRLKIINFDKKTIPGGLLYEVREDQTTIKLVYPKCCVCDEVVDKDLVNSGTKIYCSSCYSSSFRCHKCWSHLGDEYFSIESEIMCQSCLKASNPI